MKANNLLMATLKDVELEVASSSQEPPESLRKGEFGCIDRWYTTM